MTRFRPLAALLAAASLTLAPVAARAESVIEQAARTGELTMAGPVNVPPYASLDSNNVLQGYAIDLAKLIANEVSTYLGRPVKINFQRQDDPVAVFQGVSLGSIDFTCGMAFTWQREMLVDYTLPIGLSGIRLLTNTGIDGSPAALNGLRIAVVNNSLGQTLLPQLNAKATPVVFPNLKAATDAFFAGKVKGVLGDSVLLANLVPPAKTAGVALVPSQGYVRYGVSCIVPENNSTFRNLVNLAIARLQQAYLNGDAQATATVNRWFGPGSAMALPPELIKAFFESVLISHEQIQNPAPQAAPSKP
ncbi:extracellular substrate binding-like orphan protein GrrP [Synechococcus sp. FGCU-3]|nr:extracellular substrate binding-like orphan protein GrrP [Synechococcus sp. FGCU3]